jgi:uncharacterized protein (DUF58 family)
LKLTKVGRDYHLAALLAVAVGLITGVVLFAALGLAMAFASAISLVILRGRIPGAIDIITEESRVRLFKGERGSLTLRTPGLQNNWARVEVRSVTFDGPVSTAVEVKGPEEVTVTFSPETATRYSSAQAQVEVRDAVGLFSVPRSVTLHGVTVDSLPISLIARPTPVYVPPMVVGESPAGAPGKGQEFYGIEEYTLHSESRDILWKRAARAPDAPLLARVREANSPEVVRLEVIAEDAPSKDRASLVDLECEALGELGRALLLAGVDVEVVGPDAKGRAAEDEDELADAIMETSVVKDTTAEKRLFKSGPSVSVIVGRPGARILEGLPRWPVVFIGSAERHLQDPHSVDFTGVEPLIGILTGVLGA